MLFFRPFGGHRPTAAVSQTMPQVPVRCVGRHDRVFYGSVAVSMALMATAMIAVATMTALAAAKRGSGPAGIPPLAFLAIPLFDMMMFTTFITAALAPEQHQPLVRLLVASQQAGRARLDATRQFVRETEFRRRCNS